jgi:hypothetical protein
MNARRRSFLVAAFALGSALLTSACGGGATGPKVAKVTPGDMPSGAEWTGVYFEPLYGYLHLVQEGNTVSGKWQRPQKDRWGELHGEASGNVLKFSWTEYTVGAVGPNSNREGKGYLQYRRPEGDNIDDRVDGSLGVGQDEVGTSFEGIRQRNVKPDLASIGPTSAEISGGDWDAGSKESGDAESPAPPR